MPHLQHRHVWAGRQVAIKSLETKALAAKALQAKAPKTRSPPLPVCAGHGLLLGVRTCVCALRLRWMGRRRGCDPFSS